MRFLLAIILTAKVYKAAILKGLINKKLNLISVGFYQYAYREGPLGSPYYYFFYFSTLGLKY